MSQVKVIDWGLSGLFDQGRMGTVVGSEMYTAPEVLSKKPYGSSCDLWSLGVTTYVMICGKPPFWGSKPNMMKQIMEGNYPTTGDGWEENPIGLDFCVQLMQVDPAKRMTVEGIFKHPWLR